jgi:hypothetical protein
MSRLFEGVNDEVTWTKGSVVGTGVSGNKVRQIHFGSPNLTFDGSTSTVGWWPKPARASNTDAPYGSGNTFCGNTQTRSGLVSSTWMSAC